MPKPNRKKITRKRLNNALAEVYKKNPHFFLTAPKKMSFFDYILAGNIDDVQEFLDEEDFNINMVDENGNGCIWYAIDSAAGFKMMELLVNNGADINKINYGGGVPIHKLYILIDGLSPDQFRMFHYLLDQGALLIPYRKLPMERLMDQKAMDLQDELQSYASPTGEVDEILGVITETVSELAEKVDELSLNYVVHLNFTDPSNPEKHFFYVDLRMTGNQLKDFVKHNIFHNPFMNIRLLVGSSEIDPVRTLEDQNITDESTIQIVIQLTSGLQGRRGGKRKTQRRRR